MSGGGGNSDDEEFYDALDDDSKSKPPVPLITTDSVVSPPPPSEEKSNLKLIDEDEKAPNGSSTEASDLDIETHINDEMGAAPPRLSQYQARLGNSHPLSGLAGKHPGPQSDSVSEFGITSVTGSQHSVDATSAVLSLLSEGGGTNIAPRPKKIRVKMKKKSKSEFSRLLLIQELTTGIKEITSASLFCARFNSDGNFLAVSGEDGRIRIWKLVFEDTMRIISEDNDSGRYIPPRMAAIFQQEPIQILEGHEGAVLDLSWSKNNFLLSASMDRTVRLWHFSRSDCLGVFRHPDFVTSVAFHPRDDRLFVTGSLDCRLRLWSIAEKAVRAWNELPANNFVTAVSFNFSGKLVLAGTATGVCLIFETDGFNYSSQIHVHSRRGKNKIGKKICGIEPMPGKSGDEVILISSNDGRVRLYTLRDKSVVSKFIGHSNDTSQIKASFSDDGEYVISGSENNRVYLWNVENRHAEKSFLSRTPQHHVKSCEFFEAHSKTVTCAIFAPSSVCNRLQSVGLRPVPMEDHSEGQIIVAVDLNGKIKIYENNSLLESWLSEGGS